MQYYNACSTKYNWLISQAEYMEHVWQLMTQHWYVYALWLMFSGPLWLTLRAHSVSGFHTAVILSVAMLYLGEAVFAMPDNGIRDDSLPTLYQVVNAITMSVLLELSVLTTKLACKVKRELAATKQMPGSANTHT